MTDESELTILNLGLQFRLIILLCLLSCVFKFFMKYLKNKVNLYLH